MTTLDTLVTTLLQEEPTSLQNALSHNSVASLGLRSSKLLDNVFNHTVAQHVKVTDQKSSGRCWLFATCNMIRMVAMTNVPELNGLKDFELSENYLFFFDKLERYHRLLRYWLQIQALPADDVLKERYIYWIKQDPLGDGGQWDMASAIVKKYGVVPKSAYPETHHSGSTTEMNKVLKTQLFNDFETLLAPNPLSVDTVINTMTERVFRMLVGFLGKPPTRFEWDYESGKTFHRVAMTPLEFLAHTKFNPDDYISVVHDPRQNHPVNSYYRVKYLGNVRDSMVGWINVPIDRLLELSKLMINANHSVWFGCDVGQERDKASGNCNIGIINNSVTGLVDTLTKEQKLRNYLSLPNHAMLITGYHEDVRAVGVVPNVVGAVPNVVGAAGTVNRWKIENSWGAKAGSDGYLLASNEWMKMYTFQALVKKSMLNQDELTAIDGERYILQPFDPLGTLA
jgi:bleomycin hydrolase